MNTISDDLKGSRLAQNLRHMVAETEASLHSAVNSGDDKLDELRLQFQTQLRRMRTQIDELEDNAAHKARHAMRAANQKVYEHPYGAMGAAAALGLLVGVLVGVLGTRR